MLKARAADYVFFGLSEENVIRLKQGKPIKINMVELGLTGNVIIFYGVTEEAMREDLIDLVGPDTVFNDRLEKH
jgi:hypothetical protein